jgi:hypothetical protein
MPSLTSWLSKLRGRKRSDTTKTSARRLAVIMESQAALT